jgi:hypothetical protein
MTKRPGELEPAKPITEAEREARKVFRQFDAGKAMTEYETAQKALHANRERLKAERLARETAGQWPRKPRPRRRLLKNPSLFGLPRYKAAKQYWLVG